MIRIFTAYSGIGGSTIAHINLTNLLNSKGIETILYGPHNWHLNKCRAAMIAEATINPEDSLIIHVTNLPRRPPCKTIVLSCHETNVFPVSSIPNPVWDKVQFVSKSQKEWHGVDGVVIPNVISDIKPHDLTLGRVGVIGSIFEHKQTHLSIRRALEHGRTKINIFGPIEDPNYFLREIYPLLSQDVVYCGVVEDKQKMYDSVDIVYHSSKRETFNFVKAECFKAGIPYNGLESADAYAEYWDNDQIVESWKQLLEL